ncbi:Do family serine endopeptidase [Aliiroseovarius sp. Z3]|uniref:Do family serine endopeptidase n=1 Tax=Aliiroseovarius sp. Z3 TaxID=2811402 RepID=UPI0023B30125|nr:Do family serine endopeptidase [Aliiroseovarius sp. Z3]MDE9451842.1 Do family serine endopeptidase [Aliiroseovarius sp. Z3]
MALAVILATGMRAEARGAPDSFADLAEQVSPAVVNITTSTIVAQRTGNQPMIPEGSPFEDFFRDFLDRNQPGGPNGNDNAPRQRRSQALGSGFVISEDGFIVTNNHVIEGADEILIEFFNGGGELPAKVIGTDPNTDIAVLKVESDKPLPFVTFGDSDIMRVGDWVMAVGNPLGQGFSVSAGIVSQRNRELSGAYDDYIQTDAAINRGNSGGPLFNMDGEVVGVNTAILSPNGGSIGIGFAMSSAVVKRVVDQLKEFGETRRGWLGVRIQDITDDIAEALGLESTNGALITDVPDGPAKDAGILPNDIILSFDGTDVTDTRELVRIVGNAPVGKAVRVVILREGQTETLKITLGRREDANATPGDAPSDDAPEAPAEGKVLGMSLGELDDTRREDLGLPPAAEGLVVLDIDEDSEAFEKGIRAGDVVAEAGQEAVNSIAALEARLDAAKDGGRKSVLLLVRRDDNPRFVALSLE